LEGKDQEISVRGQPGKKVCETPSPPPQPMSGSGCTHLSSQLHREAQMGEKRSRLAWAQSETLSQKQSTQKRAGAVAKAQQAQGPRSTPSTEKKCLGDKKD
jgi:hypothetical protein